MSGFGRCLVAWLLAAMLTPGVALAQEAPMALVERLARVMPERMAGDNVTGAVVAIIAQGKLIGTRAFGLADPRTQQPLAPDALFRTESISKPVTAWGAMRLQHTGRLDLDAPLTQCLSRWHPPPGTPPLNLRQLLSHTAGLALGNYAARYAPAAPRPGLIGHLAEDFDMVAAPGAGFAYSDTGYNLIELVIEDCTGEAFAAFMRREVLAPLGMARASYEWQPVPMPVGHDLHGRAVAPYVYPARGSGGLYATAGDIARFAIAGMRGSASDVLPAERIAEMHRPAVTVGGLFGFAASGYGLGHFTETLSDGRTAVWHGGQGYGWMSHLHMVPETGDGIVILANSQRAWPLFATILRDWSTSLGVAPVGMARVLWAEAAARITIALLLAGALFACWTSLRRRPRQRHQRVSSGLLAAPLLIWPFWAVSQDYLLLFSILPALWPWLATASGLAGLALAAVALAPVRITI